jgi:hypothetical protein
MSRKTAYFAGIDYERWPEPHELERYFLSPPGKQWFGGDGRTDTAGLSAEGVDGTGHVAQEKGRVYLDLSMWGRSDTGVLLYYSKRRIGAAEAYTSVGDLKRLDKKIMNTHGDILPVGLFVSFERAWEAVKEFIEADGRLPKSIDWIANKDLPPHTFPKPTRENAQRYGFV